MKVLRLVEQVIAIAGTFAFFVMLFGIIAAITERVYDQDLDPVNYNGPLGGEEGEV